MAFSDKQLSEIKKFFKDAHDKREKKQAEAKEVLAIKITMEEPAPDGTFEIMFMTRDEANEWQKNRITDGSWATSQDIIEEISFAEGVTLARRQGCSGGFHALKQAKRFQEFNPAVQALNLDI